LSADLLANADLLAKEDLRARLREATGEVHARMHAHPGFAAAASGKIAANDYRDLLARLYGFHRGFEVDFARAPVAMAQAIALPQRARAAALAEDLRALGLAGEIEALPLCPAPLGLETEPQWLGALYVSEGSTLGGAAIARALAQAGFGVEQRHFFEAYGAQRSQMWRSFLARLECHAHDHVAAAEAQSAAKATFAAFERWMRDWRGAIRL
jgi:heme oxygenase